MYEFGYNSFANTDYSGFKLKQTVLLAGKSALTDPIGGPISSQMT
jgi:hypothetical protein